MSNKSSNAPGSGGKAKPQDKYLRVPLSTPVKMKGDDGEDKEVGELRMRPMRVADLKGAPVQGLTLGDLLDVGFQMAGFPVLEGSPHTPKSLFRKVHAADLDPLVTYVEESLEEYQVAIQAYDIEAVDPSQEHTVRLTAPISFGSTTVSELTLQPLNVGHLWDTPAGTGLSIYETCHLGGRQAAVSSGVIDRLGMQDAGRLGAAVTAFLIRFRKTGADPSET